MNDADNPQLSLGNIIANLPAVRAAKKINTTSRVHRRLIQPVEFAEDDDEPRLSFQHTGFCQTSLPYRNPGDDVRQWQREQGSVSLLVKAGEARHPKTRKWIELGLPWGTKPRLILAHLNAEAIRRQSPRSSTLKPSGSLPQGAHARGVIAQATDIQITVVPHDTWTTATPPSDLTNDNVLYHA